MKTFGQLLVAGVAGVVAFKILAGLLLPLLGLAAGIVTLVVKFLIIAVVGWVVVSILRGRKKKTV